jgi:hypothetical protein
VETNNSKQSSSSKTSSHFQRKRNKRKHSKSHDPKEFKKDKPRPTFDGEIKEGEETKVWILGLKKYFKFHNYSEYLKVRITIFNLNGKASVWWEDLRNVKGIHEKDL